MADTSGSTAATTLALLEERLRRVDYILNGGRPAQTPTNDNSTRPKASASARLRQLERNLQSLSAKSSAVSDVLSLQRQHPEVFDSTARTQASGLLASTLATIVLANAQLYTSTSTSLQQLASNPTIPDPASCAKVIALQPRIAAAQAKQDEQDREVAELRARSAKIMSSWYEDGVLGMGEKWAG